MGIFGLNTSAVISIVTAADKKNKTPPTNSPPKNANLGPVWAILVINYIKDILCPLLCIMGSEQNKMLHFDRSVWMDVAGWDMAEQHFQMGEKSNFQIL